MKDLKRAEEAHQNPTVEAVQRNGLKSLQSQCTGPTNNGWKHLLALMQLLHCFQSASKVMHFYLYSFILLYYLYSYLYCLQSCNDFMVLLYLCKAQCMILCYTNKLAVLYCCTRDTKSKGLHTFATQKCVILDHFPQGIKRRI